ncbi:MAG: GNAT family N-acetyltransferase [Janthinobacterium sp.]
MSISLRHFSSTDILVRLPELGALLQDCVHDGASIGFILPFDASASQAFWTDNVLPAVARGVRLLLVAEVDGRVAGAVQLDWDTNPNQAHRAEVRKLLVAPAYRRLGLARQLMLALEEQARLGQHPRLCAGAGRRPAGRHHHPVQAAIAGNSGGELRLSGAL